METERFKKPTHEQVVEFALIFNEGNTDREKLVDMVAMCQMIIDRLHDKGDIMIKSQREIDLEEEDDRLRNKFDSHSDFFDHGAY
jgi:hypothetical protein